MADIPLTKIPPHSQEAEKAALGAILIDNNSLTKIADFLKAEDFYFANHKTIFEAMIELYMRRMPIDLKILATHLEDHGKLQVIGGASYLSELTLELPTATHVIQYALMVKQKSTLRKLISAGDKITSLGYNEAGNPEELLEEAEKTLFSVSQTFVKDRFIHIKDILTQTYEKISDLHDPTGKEKYIGLPTGFRTLDYIISGLQPADLVILAARPSMGKTAFAMNMAQNIARKGKSVGIISLEMSREQLVERMFCALLGVDSWKMRTGRLTDEDFSRIGPVMDDLMQTNIFIDDSTGNSIVELRTKARRLKAEHGLDLLIIDYLQMMSAFKPSYQVNRVQEISEITRALKNLSRELHIPVMALSQLSRAVENRPSKIPQLSDLRESGCLAGDTLIMRVDTGALVPIKSLVGQTDIPVYSLNDASKLEVRKMTKVFSSGVKKLYELKTRSGRFIKASANHPFLTIDGWRSVDSLQIGTHVGIPRWGNTSSYMETGYQNDHIMKADFSGTATALQTRVLFETLLSDVYWDEIMSITFLGEEEVFDATVPITHNFVANDFIVHNSVEQDADIVLMMYREDYYEEDTDKKGITDVFIRKHRNGPTGHIQLMFEKEKVRFLDIERERTVV